MCLSSQLAENCSLIWWIITRQQLISQTRLLAAFPSVRPDKIKCIFFNFKAYFLGEAIFKKNNFLQTSCRPSRDASKEQRISTVALLVQKLTRFEHWVTVPTVRPESQVIFRKPPPQRISCQSGMRDPIEMKFFLVHFYTHTCQKTLRTQRYSTRDPC